MVIERAIVRTALSAGVVIAAIVGVVRPSAAQSAAGDGKWYAGVEAGAQAVQSVGGLVGAQVGRHLSLRADVFGEAVYLQDVATRRRVESAENVASYLALTQGRAASASIDIPTWAFGAGAKYFLTGERAVRPYVVGQAGIARVVLRPVFLLSGTDVTKTLGQYGVTLGSDLTGSSARPMFGGGIGAAAARGPWYLDVALRILSVQLESQAATSKSLAIGVGRTF